MRRIRRRGGLVEGTGKVGGGRGREKLKDGREGGSPAASGYETSSGWQLTMIVV